MTKNDSSFQINKKSLLTAALIIFVLIVASWCLTLLLPPGQYQYETNGGGENVIVPDTYVATGDAGQYPVYNIVLAIFKSFAPGGDVNLIMIVIMLFILLIGGSFTLLDKSGILRAVIARIAARMYRRRYLLIAVISFVFMFLGSFFGILEEIVPLIPLVVGLSFMLGWDSLMGLGLSLLATSFGFAAALYNPFSVAIAQNLAGVALYSGTWLRLIFFVIIYGLLLLFLTRYAKKLDRNPMASRVYAEDAARREKFRMTPAEIEEAARFKNAPIIFIGVLLAVMFVFLILASFIGLADYSMIVIAVIFIIASTVGARLAGYKSIAKTFFKGMLDIAPGIMLIPMAMAVYTIILDSGIQDTILYYCSAAISDMSPFVSILLIYAVVLVLELFVAQASAKAFLVMPLLVPLAALSHISGQSVVLAYILGDGFLNVLYPTNAMLLIALGLTTVSYPKWFRFTIGLQLIVMALSIGLLMTAVAVGY
jgi:Predicted membrane protein